MGDVLRLLEKQQVQIGVLQRDYEAIKEENEALRVCLESAGWLAREQFDAQIHRRRFAKVLEKHPCTWEVAPFEVLQTSELLRLALGYAGPAATAPCAAASRSFLRGTELLPPRLYAIGGSDSVGALSTMERFDEQAGRWECLPSMPTPRSNLVACAGGGRLYAIGGTDGAQVLGTVEMYDAEEGVWRHLPPMPTPRSGMAAAACEGYLYVVGGREGFRSLGIAERLRVLDGRWEVLPPMRVKRRFLAATALRGQLYTVGGEDDSFTPLRDVERFSGGTLGRWEQLPPMPTRRRGLAAVALRGKLYAIGGGQAAQAQASHAVDTVEQYDVDACRWSSFPPMPSPRMFLAAAALSGRLYAVGGSDGAQALRTLERFDEETNCWETLPSMPTRRVFFATAVLRA